MRYDVIIAGGSFAGLAVAAQLRGRRVLLVEPHPIGAVQTSACGTPLAVLEATDTLDSLIQVHERFVIHLGKRTVEYPLPYYFCTFDYPTLCSLLLDQGGAEVLRASVLGHAGHQVFTSRGTVEAKVLIDATGWRAALATQIKQQTEPHRGKSFGIETHLPVLESGLHFHYDPQAYQRFNVGWLFPAGDRSRAGFASYQGFTRLNEGLDCFVKAQFGVSSHERHGGYFPYASQPATTGDIFRVGDAAGQCIALTGEGIRPALYFGASLGRLVDRQLAGEITLDEALRAYRRFVANHRGAYRILLTAQKLLPGLPMGWLQAIAGQIQPDSRINAILQWYWRAIDPATLKEMWSADASEAEHILRADPLWLAPISKPSKKVEP